MDPALRRRGAAARGADRGLPGDLKSPNNPFLGGSAGDAAEQPAASRAWRIPDGRYLYPILEGATVADVTADPAAACSSSTPHQGEFTDRWAYRTDAAGDFVADVAPLGAAACVVIERDGAQRGRACSAGSTSSTCATSMPTAPS